MYIKKIILIYLFLICIITFIFTQYVFQNSLVNAQNIGYSVLISFPLGIITLIFFYYFPSFILWFLINIIFVPIVKLQVYSKNNYSVKHSKEKNEKDKINVLKIITKNKDISKKIQYLYMQKFNGNETHRFMLNNKNDYFYIFINFILDYHQLLDIINHPDISKILSNVDKLFLEKIKLEEDKYIDLYLRYNNHPIIIKEVKSLKHLGMIKIQHNIDKSWLEKFEEYVIKKNIFIFGHSNYIKQIQKNRLDEKINKYRLYIRYPDLLKKLLYIRDKEQKEYNKHFENDDFYIY